jgi:hypothetical protein
MTTLRFGDMYANKGCAAAQLAKEKKSEELDGMGEEDSVQSPCHEK